MVLLVFTSDAFVPLRSMPGWLQAIGAHQPVTALVDAEPSLILGGPAQSHVITSLAWTAGSSWSSLLSPHAPTGT
jgi:ABC-type uncharacterized transport system permease subunit